MSINFTENEKKYLKRMAALQFNGSKENYSTRHPIHFLQEQSDEYNEVAFNDYDDFRDEIVKIDYCACDDFESYETVEELVANHLGLDCADREAITDFNTKAKENKEPLFVSYDEAAEKGISGVENAICDLHDYLLAYGLEPQCVSLYKYANAWEVKAVSFTHKGAVELREKLDNHIFRPTRYYAFSTVDGDFPTMMGLLLKCGQHLLNEENVGVRWIERTHLTPEQVMKEYEQAPDKEFCLASFEMKLPPQQFENGKTQKAVLSVQAAGKISTWGSRKYPIAKLKAVLVVGEQRKECAYPFECDSIGTSLMDDQQIVALLNYIRYV